MSVTEDRVIQPNGKEGIYGFVTIDDGVSVLPMDEEGYVYLVREFQYPLERKAVYCASGTLDEGESFLDAAKRELLEELGIVAKEWIDFGEIHTFTSLIKSKVEIFLAQGLRFQEPEREETEIIEMVKVPFEEVVEMVMRSEIIHGPTALLVMKVKEYLKAK